MFEETTRRDFVKVAGAFGALAFLPGCGSGDDGGKTGGGTGAGPGEPFRGPTSALRPFVPSDKAGETPDLPKRIAWANSSDAPFLLATGAAIKAAAESRGLEYVTAISNDDAAKTVEQINTFLQRGVAALCTIPVGGEAQNPVKQQALDKGVAVLSMVAPPCSSQVGSDQAQVGRVQGEAAAAFIREQLGGEAKVVYFNADKVAPVLIPRHEAGVEALRAAGPGVEIVADMYPGAITAEAGFKTMSSILQAHPDVNVVVGDDTTVLGALNAIRSAGKADQIQYMSGVNGDEQALAEIKKGGPYKASFAFPYEVMGYAWGQYAADWLEGKAIPQVLLLQPVELSSAATIDRFRADMKDPAPVYEDESQRATYLNALGSIDYATRGNFVAYAV